jgi:hypothetical protein
VKRNVERVESSINGRMFHEVNQEKLTELLLEYVEKKSGE